MTSTALSLATSASSIVEATGLAAQFKSIVPSDLFIALGLGFLIGIVIAVVYRKTYRGVLYSPSFTLTLIMLTLITTPVVMCIKNDIALSMGMVGALSIVRFRTAVKDPLDTAYMFWALTMGILLGAGLYLIAVIVVLCIAILMFVISFAKLTTPNAAACAAASCAPRPSPVRAPRCPTRSVSANAARSSPACWTSRACMTPRWSPARARSARKGGKRHGDFRTPSA